MTKLDKKAEIFSSLQQKNSDNGELNLSTPRSFRSVGGGSPWGHLDTADTVAVNDSELDVSLVSPGGVPGVTEDPVFLLGVGVDTPSDDTDGVIDVSSALLGVEDA